MEAEVPIVESRARRRPVRLAFAVAALTLSLGVTAYLGTMTVLWGLRVHELHATVARLTDEAAASKQAATDANLDAEGRSSQLNNDLFEFTKAVHDKANAEDDQAAYEAIAAEMKSCADHRAEALGYVEQRYAYTGVARYRAEVDDYCAGVVSGLADYQNGVLP